MSVIAGKRPSIVIVDYGSGNVHSAVKAFEAAGASVELTADRRRALDADGLVVPGVGSFAHVMAAVARANIGEIIGRRLAGGRPVFGVCVGMQVLFERGLEGDVSTEGLGEWPGEVTRLNAPVLPHMGWNTVDAPESSPLFRGIRDERFYFVHSYAVHDLALDPHPKARPVHVTTATHGERFLAAVENGPLTATQFHPEKSGDAGIALIRNWLTTLAD